MHGEMNIKIISLHDGNNNSTQRKGNGKKIMNPFKFFFFLVMKNLPKWDCPKTNRIEQVKPQVQ